MIKKLFIPLAIFALAIVFFKVMLSTKDESPDIQFKEHVWRVDQTIIEQQTLSPSITLYGKIESSELVNTAAPASSQVEKILVKEGEYIEKGQLMLVLDQADFEPLLKHAQAKVSELHALIKSEELRHQLNVDSLRNEKKLLTLSEKALARAEKVKNQKLGSISETEQAMQAVESRRLSFNLMQFSVNEHSARVEQLQARLVQAEADLAKSQLALQRSKVYAPFSGIVAKVNVAQGDRVNANEKLLSFYSLEKLEIRAKLPINLLYEVQQNLSKGVKLTGQASSSGQQVLVTLERLSGEGQASGIDAIFTIEKQSEIVSDRLNSHLRIGSIVVLNLQRLAQKNLIKVPYEAMYGTDRLYKIVDQRLELVKVRTIGEYRKINNELKTASQNRSSQNQSQLLIRSEALHSGDIILTTHLPNAFTGLKVESVEKTKHLKTAQ